MRRPIIYFTLLVLLQACSEFLVVEPDSQVSITEQFSTMEGVHQAINGMYYEFEDLYTDDFFIYADLVGGNLSFSPAEKDQIVEIPPNRNIDQVYEFRDQASNSDMEGVYDQAYEIINATNLIIEQTAESSLLSDAEIQQIRAEALACRACTHYILSILYAQQFGFTEDASHPGIVYNTSTITAGVDFPARLSMKETYDLMLADLEEALDLFTGTQALPYGESKTYFNGITTASMAARIALQMNDWENALRFADTVINNSGLVLTKDTAYNSEWEHPEATLSETIFELNIPRDSDGSPGSSVAHSFYLYESIVNYADFVASGDLVDLYIGEDIRRQMLIEVLLPTSINGIITYQAYYFTRKFQVEKSTPVVRLSEMYLVRAEALARKSNPDLTAARIDLNRIRYRARLDPLVTDDYLLEEIFLERRRELAFEGFLLFDLARYQKDIIRDKGCISSVCTLTYPSDRFILPIPQNTVLLNEFMEQNEGY